MLIGEKNTNINSIKNCVDPKTMQIREITAAEEAISQSIRAAYNLINNQKVACAHIGHALHTDILKQEHGLSQCIICGEILTFQKPEQRHGGYKMPFIVTYVDDDSHIKQIVVPTKTPNYLMTFIEIEKTRQRIRNFGIVIGKLGIFPGNEKKTGERIKTIPSSNITKIKYIEAISRA